MERLNRARVVGQRIVELLPRHDYLTIVLDNGLEFDIGIDEDTRVSDPKNPEIVDRIFDLESKLDDVTYRKKEDKTKQKEYRTQIDELKKSLVGMTFSFCGKPCLVKRVFSDKKIDADYTVIRQEDKERKIHLYSLEK